MNGMRKNAAMAAAIRFPTRSTDTESSLRPTELACPFRITDTSRFDYLKAPSGLHQQQREVSVGLQKYFSGMDGSGSSATVDVGLYVFGAPSHRWRWSSSEWLF